MSRRITERLLAAALSAALTLGCLGCFLSVYALPVAGSTLVFSVLACILLGVVVLPLRRGSELTLCGAALALGYLLHRPETVGEIKSLLSLVSLELDGAWHWGYFAFPGLTPGSVTIPLCAYGGGLSLAVCRSVLRRRATVVPLAMAALPVVFCAMVPGKNPPGWAVFVLLSAAALLLLTSQARRTSALQGLRLTRQVTLPVLACVGLLLLCNPQGSYVDRAAATRERLLETLRGVSVALNTRDFTPQVAYTTELVSLSGGQQPKIALMTVTAPESGHIYLRGQDFDTYTGTQWTAEPTRVEHFDGWGTEKGSVTVETYGVRDLIYLPYYPGAGTVLTGGALANTGAVTAYTFPSYPQGSAMAQEALEAYLGLPEATKAWARDLLPENAGVGQIAALVEGSGVYDLDTPRMPEGEGDFVRWFLKTSHRGYCVHFASAATVLLRAAGIPARYVTGYLQEVTAGEKTVVTTRQAHAWTEYYDIASGAWRILDATPAAQGAGTATQPQSTPQMSTQGVEPPRAARRGQSAWLVWLVLPGAALMLLLWRGLSRALWEFRKKRSSARDRVLLLWQEAEVLSKTCGREIPEELLELAQRAKFSRHRITAMDAVRLETFCQTCWERLQAAPWWKRLWLFVK